MTSGEPDYHINLPNQGVELLMTVQSDYNFSTNKSFVGKNFTVLIPDFCQLVQSAENSCPTGLDICLSVRV